jgi:hypothetical protein
MIGLARVFRPVALLMRGLLSMGLFLPLLYGHLPRFSGDWGIELFQLLLLGIGSAWFAVWANESSERDRLNHEILATTGVSPHQLLSAKAIVGAAIGILMGIAALAVTWLWAPLAQFSTEAIFKSALFFTMGLIMSLCCSLWVASKPRARSQAMTSILFALLAVWLGLPLLGWCSNCLPGDWSRFPIMNSVMLM